MPHRGLVTKSHNSQDLYLIIFYLQLEGELPHQELVAKSHNSQDHYLIIFIHSMKVNCHTEDWLLRATILETIIL